MTDNYDDTNPIGLSRRRVLGGIGAIGVASAGAGLGTTAFFSDSESFEDNTITAGQFELHASQMVYVVDQDGTGPDEVLFEQELAEAQAANPDAAAVEGALTITDAKPGDSYKLCWDPCVKYNPGYIRLLLDNTAEATGEENGVTHTDASGVLSEYFLAVVTVTGQDGVEAVVFEGTLAELIAGFGDGSISLIHSTADVDDDGFEVDGSAEYCHDPCEVMDDDESDDSSGDDGETGDVDDESVDPVEVCIYLYLPSHADVGETVTVGGVDFDQLDASDSPGNLVQGASFETDIVFEAEQCRHNETPFQDEPEENGELNGTSVDDGSEDTNQTA